MSVCIVDFDGTLVQQNSSRVLEKEIYNFIESFLQQKVLYFLYFSSFSSFFNLCRLLLSKLFADGVDLRLKSFVFFSSFTFKKYQDEILDACVKKLTLNQDLLSEVEGSFIIASLGLNCVIHRVVNHYRLPVKEVFSSVMDEKLSLSMKNYNAKIAFLNQYNAFEYITDDPKEFQKIIQKIPNVVEKKKL